MKTRKYNKTRRAEQQTETRERIIKATVALHNKLGPANTSIKAIAEKAGVQRLTVYRYFPDDASLYQACTSHWLSQHPPPNPDDWANIESAEKQTCAALLMFFQYYRRTETMWTGAYRDVENIVALKKEMAHFEAYIDQVRDTLLIPWKLTGKPKQQLAITLRHGLRFSTWQSLKRDKLKDKPMAELVMSWIHRA